ncbi:polysaccharide export protein [Halorubrum distributum JCM 9100]|uniref:Polysaccharide export protein n=2 Tax=Halorubrum distributum TaxID=29283 RepID=M0EW84_9EURY|nr:flippase [Halorubrum distributum]ELZ51162.1 polysaccharide export protein [Halorubrum distributum JCM 9100]ELZ53042.1 polysaccharide export protein [Halorubrum distributum JCM 10118]
MDFRKILSDAGFSAVGRFVATVRGFAFVPVITKIIGTDSYGLWVTAIAVAGIASHVGGMYIYSSLIRYLPSDGEQVFSDTLVLTLLASCTTTGVLLIGGAVGDNFFAEAALLEVAFVPIAIYAGADVLLVFLNNYLRARQKVKHFEVVTTLELAVETVVVLSLLLYTGDLAAGFWGLAATTIAYDMLLLGVFLWNRPPLPNPQNFDQYLSYSIPMIPKGFGGKMVSHADKFLIIYFLGATSAGTYAVAYGVSGILTSLSGVFNSTLFPNVSSAWAKNDLDQISVLYERLLRWFTVLLIPAATGITFLASEVLRVISTAEVVNSGTILVPLLLIGFSFQAAEIPLGHVLSAAEETKLLSYITLITAAINVIANLVLIPTVGLPGAAIATTIAFLIRTVWTYRCVTDYVDITVEIVPVLKSVIATGCMVAILFVAPLTQPEWRLIVYPLIGVIAFGCVFVVIGGLEQRDWDAINQFV